MSEFYDISREIASELGVLLTVRPYCGIINALGEICYMDSDLEEYKPLIKNFMETIFPMVKVGDHSVPLSGTNMIFFKVSKKAMIILLTKKGALGQLLTFKNLMQKYTPRIDSLIGDIEITDERGIKESTIEEKGKEEIPEKKEVDEKAKSQLLPLLIKSLKDIKIPIEHATILSLCDGENDVDDIIKETKKDRLFINSVIREYQKKGYIKLKKAS